MTTAPLASLSTLALAAASLLLAQVLAWALARGSRLRLERGAVAAGVALACLLVTGWAADDRLLAPVDQTIANLLPDAPAVTGPDRHGILNDAVLQFLPWETEIRRAFADGRLPLWSDLLDGGSSPWANPQAGVLSPVHVLTRFVPIEHWLLVALAVKLLVAYQGSWLLARSLGCRRPAAHLAGLAVALGPLTPWAVFPHSAAIAWLPWLVAATIRAGRRGGRGPVATAGVIFAVVLLSGHPETALAGGCLAAIGGAAFARPGAVAAALRRGAAAAEERHEMQRRQEGAPAPTAGGSRRRSSTRASSASRCRRVSIESSCATGRRAWASAPRCRPWEACWRSRSTLSRPAD